MRHSTSRAAFRSLHAITKRPPVRPPALFLWSLKPPAASSLISPGLLCARTLSALALMCTRSPPKPWALPSTETSQESIDAAAAYVVEYESELPPHFISAMSISSEDHLRVLAAAQRNVDNSVSKTCNDPGPIRLNQSPISIISPAN